MIKRHPVRFAVLLFCGLPPLFFIGARSARCEDAGNPGSHVAAATPQQVRGAIERALAFLQKDVVRWREEHGCSTCHHGLMTVWVHGEARSRGYEVKPETVTETLTWAKERILERIDKPRDARPGWSMVNTPAIYLALIAQFVDKQDVVSADDLRRIRGHLLRHQEADGSWAWSSAPPINRPPPFFESDEVATRLAYMALEPHLPPDAKGDSAARDSREKAAAWLSKTEPSDSTQAAALRLLMKVRAREPAESIAAATAPFFSRQNDDGGWGQLDELPSDAYATGQALYVLSLAGVDRNRAEVRRAVTFLVTSLRDDGSWPMKSRAHAGATPYKNPVPITYFGSAWAALGLIRSASEPVTGKTQFDPLTPEEQHKS